MKQILLFATLLIGSLAVQAQSIEALRDSMAAGNLKSRWIWRYVISLVMVLN